MGPLLFLKGLSPTTWIMIGMGVVIAALMASLWIQNVRLDSAKNEIASLENDVRSLKDMIAKQNAGILALADTKKELEDNLANARKINVKRQRDLEIALNTIRNQPVPEDLQGRLDYVLDALTENAAKWNSEQ